MHATTVEARLKLNPKLKHHKLPKQTPLTVRSKMKGDNASALKSPPKFVVDENADDQQIAASLLGAIAMADRAVAADGSVDRVIGNAAERLTLDDLLGIKPTPRKRAMEIYLGAQRTVINFDESSPDSNDARIPTPIVNAPIPSSRPAPQFSATTAQK